VKEKMHLFQGNKKMLMLKHNFGVACLVYGRLKRESKFYSTKSGIFDHADLQLENSWAKLNSNKKNFFRYSQQAIVSCYFDTPSGVDL